MATGWRKIGGRYYYLSGANDGHMVTGTKTIKGVKYRFNASGALVSPKAPKK
jgi:glucan-binding YG repeat protein